MEGQQDRSVRDGTATPTPEADPRLDRVYDREPGSPYTAAEPLERPLTATEARQGYANRPLLYALILGLVLAVIYIVATQIWTASEPLPSQPVELPAAAPVPGPPAVPAPAPADQPVTPTPQ